MPVDPLMLLALLLPLVAAAYALAFPATAMQRRRIASVLAVAATLGALSVFRHVVAPPPLRADLAAALPWLSRSVFSVVALGAGTLAAALSPVRGARRSDFAVLCGLVAAAAMTPLLHSPLLLVLVPLLALLCLIPTLAVRDDSEAVAVLILWLVPSALLALLGLVLLPGQTIWLVPWLATVAAVPPLSSWHLRVATVAPLPVLTGVLILQAAVLAAAPGQLIAAPAVLPASLFALAALLCAGLALSQLDARRVIAYLLASNLATAGFANFGPGGPASLIGGTLMLLTLVSALAGVVLLLGALEARTGSRLHIARPAGVYAAWPRLANTFLVLALIAGGLPLTVGYLSAELVVLGSFEAMPARTMAVILAGMLNAITIVRMALYLFQGVTGEPQGVDLAPRELIATGALLAGTLGGALLLLPR